jgi:hypothetical protein
MGGNYINGKISPSFYFFCHFSFNFFSFLISHSSGRVFSFGDHGHGSSSTRDSSNTSKSNNSSSSFSSDDGMIQQMFVDMDKQRQYR